MADSVEARVIAASPPGCLPQVLGDLSVISPAVATNSNAAIQQYCESIGMVLTSSTDRDEPMTKVLMCRQARVDGADEYVDVTGRKQCTITWGAVPSILSVKDRTNDETSDSDMRTLADAVFEAFEGHGMTSGVWIKDGAIHIVRSSLVMRKQGLR
ncbi:hypothetical protein FOZ63_023273 [Perkinsus olseni]|uniref:Uncharacterized protein n=1 Tax=Perkinsus olseni TaxID=32597 RepID=A0A7J6RW23_PEROL|nr:hypothetical protein FOZ63_023273 [Perkinsus olseni]